MGKESPKVSATWPCPPYEFLILPKARDILVEISRALESLHHIWGIQSFVLAVDPQYPANESFLGGSTAGRDFWRGLRGGGESGATSFKQQCIKQMGDSRHEQSPAAAAFENSEGSNSGQTSADTVGKQSQPSAREVKSELYDSIRRSLRCVLIIFWAKCDRPGLQSR